MINAKVIALATHSHRHLLAQRFIGLTVLALALTKVLASQVYACGI